MGFGNDITVVGNLVRDPELRYTASGAAVLDSAIAWNKKDRDGNEETSFFDFVAWNDLAENIGASLSKGDRVVVVGTLVQESWETKEGEKRSKVRILADEVSPSLRWATAPVSRNERKSGGSAPKKVTVPDIDEEPF